MSVHDIVLAVIVGAFTLFGAALFAVAAYVNLGPSTRAETSTPEPAQLDLPRAA